MLSLWTITAHDDKSDEGKRKEESCHCDHSEDEAESVICQTVQKT